jgi:CRP-like cAMP-binding protein
MTLGPGQLFGEPGALSGMPQSATFTAVVRSVVLAIDRSALRDLFTQSASADLAQRVRETLSTLNR